MIVVKDTSNNYWLLLETAKKVALTHAATSNAFKAVLPNCTGVDPEDLFVTLS